MTTLQIISLIPISTLYIIWSVYAIKDIKNQRSDNYTLSTNIWESFSIAIIVCLVVIFPLLAFNL